VPLFPQLAHWQTAHSASSLLIWLACGLPPTKRKKKWHHEKTLNCVIIVVGNDDIAFHISRNAISTSFGVPQFVRKVPSCEDT
jgi:hypothetical protein